MDVQTFLRLLAVFVPLSLLSVGGGQAVVADIHRQVVAGLGWMTDGQFVDLFAVSRMAPGPGSLLASLVGWRVSGWSGAVIASLAFFGPSSLVFFALAHFWTVHPRSRLMQAVEEGLAPVSAGLMLATIFVLLASADGGILAWAVALVSTLALVTNRAGPFALLGLGAAVFLVLG
ncbi:MAG: chromate transporter [Ancalomicrobiaceae bacterium]|nr:chromate transporter [Ancalomicrobiaceae bacterium]